MEMRQTVREIAIDHIKELTASPLWADYLETWQGNLDRKSERYCSIDKLYDSVYPESYETTVDCSTGAEKVAFVYGDFDWVIKFERFGDEPDDCEVEAYNYAKAVECGIGKWFAPTYFLTEIDGIKFYIQAKCHMDACGFEDKIYDYVRQQYRDDEGIMGEYKSDEALSCDKWYSYGDCDTTCEWLCDQWGSEDFDAVMAFCDKYAINDLHCGNIGYYEGRIILTDFSGFHCRSWEWFDSWKDRSDKAVDIKF